MMMLLRLLLLLGAALAALPLLRAAEAQAPAGATDGAFRGYLAARVVDGGALEVVDELNAGRLFVPASVLKVVTVAAALEHLGPDYRWRTRLTTNGALADGVLDGDLVVEPGADPTWGAFFDDGAGEPLAALAGQVRARGVTRVTGDLVVDARRFPGRLHPLDRSFGDLPYRHGAPPSGLAVDEATITVRVAPGPALGAPARVRAPGGVDVINRTLTVGRDRHGAGSLDFLPVWGTDTLLLRGEYPISEPSFTIPASDPAPVLRAARRLRDALHAAGVAVEGAVRLQARTRPAPDPAAVLAELHSPPMEELLPEILTRSHNWYADTLILTLGLEVAETGRFDDGVEVVADFVEALPDPGTPVPPEPALRDGSGLSAANLIAPATVVRVLAHAAGRPWAEKFIDALAGRGEGTLRAWPSLPPLAAKTGTLRHTVALAGIIGPDSDAPVVFCYFVNHHTRPRSAARGEIAAALRRWRTAAAR
ncbi:MAG: D-alanyl-D-alanine carboxypeptidase/D-alanyl-D-alanine-endopeptidase [Acidobacteria bacterium]|nr:D-alanyl-D-alanine carboxypeptidase/D-alanyl-D-alanine-endopeptidase [Acidobacteriota bacterium]